MDLPLQDKHCSKEPFFVSTLYCFLSLKEVLVGLPLHWGEAFISKNNRNL